MLIVLVNRDNDGIFKCNGEWRDQQTDSHKNGLTKVVKKGLVHVNC